MFNRLVDMLGRSAPDASAAHHEIQLAASILLAAVVPADFQSLAKEHAICTEELAKLFKLNASAAGRLYGRALAARASDPAIFPAATILKRATDRALRVQILNACRAVAEADGSIHEFEQELLQRIEMLLDIRDMPLRKSA